MMTINSPNLPPILTTKEYKSLQEKYNKPVKSNGYNYKPYRTLNNY